MNAWDFTLYSAEDGSRVMKVVFSDGEYRVDIGRYFLIADNLDTADTSLDQLKRLAEHIRNTYPESGYIEIKRAELHVVKKGLPAI